MRVEKKSKEFMKETGLKMLQAYYYEKAFIDLALQDALVPRATESFVQEANARIRKLMRELERIVTQYKRQPPSGPSDSNGGRP